MPRLTTVAQPTDTLATVATKHLIGLVEGRIEVEFGMEFVTTRLIVGESCGLRTTELRATQR